MHTTECSENCPRTYYVPGGSGLIAVPRSRLNEIPLLKVEHHRAESDRALAAAKARKLA